MFTTSTLQTAASLGGLTGADALCMNLAANAKLTATKSVALYQHRKRASRLGAASGWSHRRKTPFSTTSAIFFSTASGKFFYPPRLDEKGNDLDWD